MNISANDKIGLQQITAELHDRFFDFDRTVFDAAAGTVIFPFPKDRLRLVVRNVRRCKADDTERVGLYDFNKFVFDPSASVLRILTGIPIGLELEVGSIDVRLESVEE